MQNLFFAKLLAWIGPQLLPGAVRAYIHRTGCDGASYQTALRVKWNGFVIKGRPEEKVRERCDSVKGQGKSGYEEEREAHRSLGLVEFHSIFHPPPLPPVDQSAQMKHLWTTGWCECTATRWSGAYPTIPLKKQTNKKQWTAGVEIVSLMSEVRGRSRLVGEHRKVCLCLHRTNSPDIFSTTDCNCV